MNSINRYYLVIIYSIRVPRPLMTVSTADIPVLYSAEVVHFYCVMIYPFTQDGQPLDPLPKKVGRVHYEAFQRFI